MKIEDLNLAGRVKGIYELKPGVVYVVIVDGKNFTRAHISRLFDKVELEGIDLRIHVVATLHPEGIQIHEATP